MLVSGMLPGFQRRNTMNARLEFPRNRGVRP